MSGADAALILVVDDDPEARMLLQRVLAGAGLRTLPMPDGAAALALLADTVPDLILLDAVMPAPDGFETCRRIKAMPAVAHVPVIFMTGLSDTEHVVEGFRAGGVDYVTKPIILDELLARIRVHLANARLTRSALTALDTSGRRLIATDREGHLRWATPEASRLLGEIRGTGGEIGLEGGIVQLIAEAEGGGGGDRPMIRLDSGGRRLELLYLGPAQDGEHFFRLSESIEGMETGILQNALGLTPREADVLLWIARGKSNRDASEILNISARTVNKHLEQVFIKLGVENRAAAAAIATRVMSAHG